MASTTYDINVRYKLEDRASKGAKSIGTEIQKTTRHGKKLLSTMKVLAAGAVVGFGLRAGKKWLIDYNSSLADTKLKMSGLIKLNLGGTWSENQAKANSLIEQFKHDAKASAGTMQDFAEFSGMIVGPALRAKMSMADLRDVTKGGVIAAKAFGIEAGMAALDIEQALAGTLSKKDRFARALLEPMGVTTEAWNAMVKETPGKAASALVEAFNQPALKDMAKAYETSWSGVTSTLEDNLQQTLGKVGLPLMKALTKEVKAMNSYFEKNPQKIAKFAKDFSEGLVTGFGYVKDVIKLIVDNSSTLLSIAKAFVGFKLIQGAGGLLAGPFDMLARHSKGMNKASKSTMSFANKATFAANKMQAVGTVLGLVYAAATGIAALINKRQEEGLKRDAGRPQAFLSSALNKNVTSGRARENFTEYAGEGERKYKTELTKTRARKTFNYAKNAGLLTNTGEIDVSRFASAMTGREGELPKGEMSRLKVIESRRARLGHGGMAGAIGAFPGADPRSEQAYNSLIQAIAIEKNERTQEWTLFSDKFEKDIDKAGGLMSLFAKQVVDREKNMVERSAFNVVTGEGEYSKAPKATKKNGDVKVYINTIKVAADDPDRFAMRMVGAFKNANTKAVASRIAVPGGRPA